MLQTRFIATHITNLTDARYFAAWGADYLGYLVDPDHPEALALDALKEISDWVEGPETLLEYEGLQARGAELFRSAGYDKAILGPFVEKDEAWKEVFRIIRPDDLKSIEAGNYILRLPQGMVDLPIVSEDVVIYLDTTSLSLKECLLAVKMPTITGLVVRGSEESKVGVKTYDELDELFEALEE